MNKALIELKVGTGALPSSGCPYVTSMLIVESKHGCGSRDCT